MDLLNLAPIIKPDSNKLEEAYEVCADIETEYLGTTIRVPKFFQYDGASIPSMVWPLIGSPFNPRFMVPAVFHDWIYHTHIIDEAPANELFYELLLKNKVGETKAVIMKKAVETFAGWYWDNDSSDISYIESLKKRITDDGRNPSDYGL